MADASKLLSNLNISLKQKSTNPTTVAITVTNNNSGPVTFLRWDSPLDPNLLQLGGLSVTHLATSKEVDIPQIKIGRRTPPGDESLVEIGAGATSDENVVELKEMVVGKKLRELGGGKASLRCKGPWRAAWAEKRDDLGPERREAMEADESAVSGTFESEAVEVSTD